MTDTGKCYELHGQRIFECAAKGAQLRDDRDAVNLIGAASAHRARLIVIPVERLGEDFFSLKTGVAGAMLQKFVTYEFRVAIIGKISKHLAQSPALLDFVNKCNRGVQIWLLANIDQLGERLNPRARES